MPGYSKCNCRDEQFPKLLSGDEKAMRGGGEGDWGWEEDRKEKGER